MLLWFSLKEVSFISCDFFFTLTIVSYKAQEQGKMHQTLQFLSWVEKTAPDSLVLTREQRHKIRRKAGRFSQMYFTTDLNASSQEEYQMKRKVKIHTQKTGIRTHPLSAKARRQRMWSQPLLPLQAHPCHPEARSWLLSSVPLSLILCLLN